MSGESPEPAAGDFTDWLLVSLASPPSGEALLLVDALRGLGARSVEREGARVMALFPPHDDPADLAVEIRLAARASTRITDPDVVWSRLRSGEWDERWGGGHPPRRVSDRLVVVAERPAAAAGPVAGAGPDAEPERGPDAEADVELDLRAAGRAGIEARPGDRIIRLEPSVAFGSADHPTTRSCLRMLDPLVTPGDRVLDVGAGSGVLAIAAVLLGARRATAVESDPASCAAARRNAARNGVADRVRVAEVEVVPGSLRRWGRFDGIVANLRAEILRPLLVDLARALANGGWLVVAGVVRPERDAVLGAGDAAGLRLVAEEVTDGWWTGRLRA